MHLDGIKKQFPIFNRLINGKSLIYLDSAATSQKPQCVLDTMDVFYRTMNANIHRGVHVLSEEATTAYEQARIVVASFFNAADTREIVFTKSATESINLVACGWGDAHIKQGDEIIVSKLEHHANLVPWQELARRREATLNIIPITDDYQLDYDAFEKLLSKRTKLVSMTALSNVTGTIPPLKKFIDAAHHAGALVLVDASQAAAHMQLDVSVLDCDFAVCSSHKMYGPTGVGVLYAKAELLDGMNPLIYGGDMVTTVGQYSAQYREAPWRFEGGTPNIAGVIGFGEACAFLSSVGMNHIFKHSQDLRAHTLDVFGHDTRVRLLTPKKGNADAIISFVVDGIHPHDIASIFDSQGIAIRSGLHCAEPLHTALGIDASARMSFGAYTSVDDIDAAWCALQKAFSIFKLKTKS